MTFPRIRVDRASEDIVESYCSYELSRRRLSELTVTNAAYHVRQYLAWRASTRRPPLPYLDASELHEYVLHEARRLSIGGTRTKIAILRTFTRFLFATGVTAADLTGSIQSVSGIRFDGLPKALDPTTLRALIHSCRRDLPNGRRDYAILLLMSRLGLRAVEVSRLRLEDVDWRSGVITVRGKGGRLDSLPLPSDVGRGLAEYLALARRQTTSRAVFLQARGDPVAMSRNAVVLVSRSASARAGVTVVGGHRLRHTTATELLRHGASLREVGEVLRQSNEVTTSMYAKVDSASLALVVRPWPAR